MPFDLSKVIFVATANRIQPIPPALLDRMEVIELPGYTPEEKLNIAMKHLIPRVLDQHGLTSEFLQIPEVRGPLKILNFFFWWMRPDTSALWLSTLFLVTVKCNFFEIYACRIQPLKYMHVASDF